MTFLEITRWILFATIVWYLPGVVAAHCIRDRVRVSAPTYLAICWATTPVLFSILAVLLSSTHIAPWQLALGLGLVGAVLGCRRAIWLVWWSEVRRVPILFGLPILLGAALWAAPPSVDMTSDAYAHISAVRATISESAVFPLRGFHGDELSRGMDPRFGTLHAFYGVASVFTGTEPVQAWAVLRGLGMMVVLAGALALICTMASSTAAITAGVVALAVYGGGVYNLLAVTAYPLWFSLGIAWTLIASVFGALPFQSRSTGLVVGIGLAALAGIHLFAFMLCGFMLAAIWLGARTEDRAVALRVVLWASALALPIVAFRVITSYASVNPIHQKIWQCMDWGGGLYAANPLFVMKWLFPFGVGALIWAAASWRRMRFDGRYRWLMVCAALVLVWTSVPWFLTPTMGLIGFLPLRLYMAIGTPFIIALLVDELGVRRIRVAAAIIVLLLPAVSSRARAVFTRRGEEITRTQVWRDIIQDLRDEAGQRVVLLSDPFTMLAAHAMADVDVVAVPDGRSSPRDPLAIERLRDSWRAMSPATDGSGTESVIARRGVTHVLLNAGHESGLASYEYPMHNDSIQRQLTKFRDNPGHFSLVRESDGLALFSVNPTAGSEWNEDYLQPCRATSIRSGLVVDIGEGYQVHGVDVEVADMSGHSELVVRGTLVWPRPGPAPDRQLILRLDRVPTMVPAALWFVAKPVRKMRERLFGVKERYRWTTYPQGGRCPTWVAGDEPGLDLEFRVALPSDIEPASYKVTLAARDRSIFVPISPSDLFLDRDSFQGPEIAIVQLPE